ncbi:MAG: hypothetical protein IIA02_02795 [Proteobacteria bacterium]|uniref:hypothetical protein n=1 Tax=Aquabacterium sp. TaxID=1872578 RepID=UPI0035C68294|nr:hypothetical protein [Pseudomonadota bacterium]
MRYVVRDPQGTVVSLHREAVPDAELLPLSHPDVQAFLHGQGGDAKSFAAMDADLVRVLEDLIDVLLRRNVFRITDLPLEAQVKLFERKHFRDNLQAHSLNLFAGQQAPVVADAVNPLAAGDVVPSDLVPLDWPASRDTLR